MRCEAEKKRSAILPAAQRAATTATPQPRTSHALAILSTRMEGRRSHTAKASTRSLPSAGIAMN